MLGELFAGYPDPGIVSNHWTQARTTPKIRQEIKDSGRTDRHRPRSSNSIDSCAWQHSPMSRSTISNL
jgi:hypothetical protein